MHYADGTPAMVGDVVTGKGYNVKDEKGQLKEIAGVVSYINEGASSCNIQVQMLNPIGVKQLLDEADAAGGRIPRHNLVLLGGKFFVTETEYGQCDHFNLVRRAHTAS